MLVFILPSNPFSLISTLPISPQVTTSSPSSDLSLLSDEPTAVSISAASSMGLNIDSITLRDSNGEEETLPLSSEPWEALRHEGGDSNATFVYGTSFATVKV